MFKYLRPISLEQLFDFLTVASQITLLISRTALLFRSQAVRKAVERFMIDNAGTALSVVGAGCFGTNALFYFLAFHFWKSLLSIFFRLFSTSIAGTSKNIINHL